MVKSPLHSIEIVSLNVLQMPAAAMTLSQYSRIAVLLHLQLKSVTTAAKDICFSLQTFRQLMLVSTLQASH